MPNNWKGHLGISVSELYFKNALGLLINNRSNFQEERIIIRKIAVTFREERLSLENSGLIIEQSELSFEKSRRSKQ